ncbi:MAG: UDP-N-acetylglucosamine 2-epimerase (non-hydrolyzing) [Chloroflexota bacterium]
MAHSLKLLLVAGARPNFMKIAPIIRAIRAWNATGSSGKRTLEYTLLHTGQHYDYEMSAVFFQELDLPEPDVHMEVGSASHGEQTARVLMGIEKLLQERPPDLVMVVGDVNSTLAGALAAVKLHIPVAHVEAGLRSFDRRMPEEINRLLTDAISDYLFTTSEEAADNLAREGVPREKVFFVGNVMIDNLRFFQAKLPSMNRPMPFGLGGREYVLATLHRPSNVDVPSVLRGLLDALDEISARAPVIFPAHPRTAKAIADLGLPVMEAADLAKAIPHTGVHMTRPLGYIDFLHLMIHAKLVLTDSGGVQEETTVLGVPCLTLRDATERPVTVNEGTNKVIGIRPSTIVEEALKVLKADAGDREALSLPRMWDGRAAERIVQILAQRCASGTLKHHEQTSS